LLSSGACEVFGITSQSDLRMFLPPRVRLFPR
jgi:hypothetical protein